MRLVADVGGTNTRLALSQGGLILDGSAMSYANADWSSLYAVIDAYLPVQSGIRIDEMVVAVAGPVQNDAASLTNRNWSIKAGHLVNTFGCRSAVLLNDLTALGYSVPVLHADQIRTVFKGPKKKTGRAQSLVVGLGTGFNVSPVLESTQTVFCPAVEAGHVSMPRSISEYLIELNCDPSFYPSVEDLFSGRGFTLFCQSKTKDPSLSGISAIAAYGGPNKTEVTTAINEYAGLLGLLLQELSLAYLPSSGIYLAGSVARAIVQVAASACIDTYKNPCNFNPANTPSIFVIEDDTAALNGCAVCSNS